MATSRRRVFEELGLLEDASQADPYKVLGLDLEFAGDLLKEDPDGELLKFVAGSLYKALARRFHPDAGPTGDAARFRELDEAHTRLKEASKASLALWLKRENTSSPDQLRKVQAERESLMRQAADLLQMDLELGNHPKHFSRLEWAQGVLLQRTNSMLLTRQLPQGGVEVLKGVVSSGVEKMSGVDLGVQAFDFQSFLRQNESFGVEPGTKVVAYIDEKGRASLLSSDLTFMMDITDPVADRRRKREKALKEGNIADLWSRRSHPLLLITETPTDGKKKIDTQIVNFPGRVGPDNTGQNLTWELPMQVVGSVADQGFFNRVRYDRTLAAAALTSGSDTQRTVGHFNLMATQARALIELEAGYSPLLADGHSLLLFDTFNNMPVATDARIVGMVGSDAQAV